MDTRYPIPERRRQHFATNGGRRLSKRRRELGLAGVAACRRVLREHDPSRDDVNKSDGRKRS